MLNKIRKMAKIRASFPNSMITLSLNSRKGSNKNKTTNRMNQITHNIAMSQTNPTKVTNLSLGVRYSM